MKSPTTTVEQPPPQVGWRIADWRRAVGVSDQMLFIFWREGRGPHRVKLGKRLVIIVESPSDYLQRMAETPPPPSQPKPPTAKTPVAATGRTAHCHCTVCNEVADIAFFGKTVRDAEGRPVISFDIVFCDACQLVHATNPWVRQ
jgi:hypothetical protein